MSTSDNQAVVPAAEHDNEPFPSLAALRVAHAELLKRSQRDGPTPGVIARASAFIHRGVTTGALLDDENERDAAQSLLDYWSTIILRAGQDAPDALIADFDPNQAPEIPDEACPYLGLDPFNERNRETFFGRRRLVEWLVQKLASQPMLALVGPSGGGKSSLIRAGLIPALKDGALPGSSEWRYFPPFAPGAEPLTSLARQLRRRLGVRWLGNRGGADPIEGLVQMLQPAEEIAALAKKLREQPSYLAEALAGTGEPVVMIVDQFEELFTLCEDDGARDAFVAAMLSLLEQQSLRHLLILTMRSDFESFVATSPALQSWFERTRVQLMPLTAVELREAIEKPAELVGLRFEAGVVDQLIHDMLGEPAALPLLQFTLLRLWSERDRNRVTWEAYRKVGGGRQALARSADDLFNKLIPEDQVTARRILLRIVRPGEGLEITSNPVRRETLYRAGEARDRVDRVLEKLVQARLVRLTEGDTLSSAQVELAHEALVRNWPTLVQWLEDERAAVAMRRRLEAKATEWVRLGRGTAGLLDERQLAEAQRWLESAEAAYLGYDPALPELVKASEAALESAREAELRHAQELAESRWIQAEQNRQLAEALRVQKEQAEQLAAAAQEQAEQSRQLAEAAQVQAEQSRRLAETQTRAASRLRLLAVAIAILSGTAIAAAIFAAQFALDATAQRRLAQQQVGIVSTQAVELQAASSAEAQQAFDARNARATAETSAAQAEQSAAQAQTAQTVAESARATAVAERAVSLERERESQSGRLAAESQAAGNERPVLGLLLGVEALNVTRDAGQPPLPIALSTLRTELVRVGGRGRYLHDGPINALATTQDGERVVTGGEDGRILIWRPGALGEPPQALTAAAPVRRLALSPDGRWLVTSGEAAESAQLWDLSAQPPQGRALTGHSATITVVAISQDGALAVTASEDGTVRVWPTAGGAARVLGRTGNSAVRALAISPNSAWVLTGAQDGISRLWDLRRADPVSALFTRDRRGPLTTAAISADGRWLVTGSDDGNAHLWPLTTSGFGAGGPFVLRGRGNPITALAISPNSALAATGTADGTVRLWALAAQQDPPATAVMRGQEQRITALAFSGDSNVLTAASEDGTAARWDLTADDPGTTLLRLLGHDAAVNAIAISLDNRWIVTGSSDRSARVWPLDRPIPSEEAIPTETEDLVRLACEVAGRSMTPDEWEQYLPGRTYSETCPARRP
jgi:WD40 repeat protein